MDRPLPRGYARCARCDAVYDPRENVGRLACSFHPGQPLADGYYSCCGFARHLISYRHLVPGFSRLRLAPSYISQKQARGCQSLDHDIDPAQPVTHVGVVRLYLPEAEAFSAEARHTDVGVGTMARLSLLDEIVVALVAIDMHGVVPADLLVGGLKALTQRTLADPVFFRYALRVCCCSQPHRFAQAGGEAAAWPLVQELEAVIGDSTALSSVLQGAAKASSATAGLETGAFALRSFADGSGSLLVQDATPADVSDTQTLLDYRRASLGQRLRDPFQFIALLLEELNAAGRQRLARTLHARLPDEARVPVRLVARIAAGPGAAARAAIAAARTHFDTVVPRFEM